MSCAWACGCVPFALPLAVDVLALPSQNPVDVRTGSAHRFAQQSAQGACLARCTVVAYLLGHWLQQLCDPLYAMLHSRRAPVSAVQGRTACVTAHWEFMTLGPGWLHRHFRMLWRTQHAVQVLRRIHRTQLEKAGTSKTSSFALFDDICRLSINAQGLGVANTLCPEQCKRAPCSSPI